MNPNEYGYLGNERFEISAGEFQLIKRALEQGVNNTAKIDAPEVVMYLDASTGNRVENPSEEDLALGRVLLTTDKEATFSQANMRYTYDMSKLTREMLTAQELIMDIHLRNVESGVSKHIEELKKASEIKLEKVDE